MASPLGRGAQVRLDGDAQARARGAGGRLLDNIVLKEDLERDGLAADGNTPDGSTVTGHAARDEALITGGVALPDALDDALEAAELAGQAAASLQGSVAAATGAAGTATAALTAVNAAVAPVLTAAAAVNMLDARVTAAERPKSATGWRRTFDWLNRGDLHLVGAALGFIGAFTPADGASRAWSPDKAVYVVAATTDMLGVAVTWRRTFDWPNTGADHIRATATGFIAGTRLVDGTVSEWGGTAYVSPLYTGGTAAAVKTGLLTVRSFDWVNVGAEAVASNADGYVGAFTDSRSVRQVWNERSRVYTPPGQVRAEAFTPASYPQAEAAARQFGAFARRLGISAPNGTATPPLLPADQDPEAAPGVKGNDTLPPVRTNDSATYWPYHAWQIPCFAQVLDVNTRRQREFYTTYGRNDLPPGATYPNGDLIGGEGAPCYVTLECSDDQGATIRTERQFFVPRPFISSVQVQGVIDPHLFAMPEGPLAILVPVTGPSQGGGNGRTVYGYALMNPLDDPASWVFGPPSRLGPGFVGKPYMHGGEVRFTTADAGGAYRLRYCRLRLEGNVLKSDLISFVPAPGQYGFGANFAEACEAPVAPGRVLMDYRVNEGRVWTFNDKDGADGSWTPPILNPLTASAPTRNDMLLLPNGMHAYFHNPAIPGEGVNRSYGQISISDDGMASFRWTFRFEPRVIASYFSAAPLLNMDGSWGGKVVCMYDRGRNRVAQPGGPAGGTLGMICRAEIDVFSIIAGNPQPAVIRDRELPI